MGGLCPAAEGFPLAWSASCGRHSIERRDWSEGRERKLIQTGFDNSSSPSLVALAALARPYCVHPQTERLRGGGKEGADALLGACQSPLPLSLLKQNNIRTNRA